MKFVFFPQHFHQIKFCLRADGKGEARPAPNPGVIYT